jgi:hypothetical protein
MIAFGGACPHRLGWGTLMSVALAVYAMVSTAAQFRVDAAGTTGPGAGGRRAATWLGCPKAMQAERTVGREPERPPRPIGWRQLSCLA